MSDLNEFASRLQVPDKAWSPRVESTGQEALVITKPYAGEQKHDDLMRENGFPPEEYELDGPVTFSKRELVSGDEVVSYRFKVRKRHGDVSLAEMLAEVKAARPSRKAKKPSGNKALVVCFADPQTGKLDRAGGTPELIARIDEKLDKLETHARKVGARQAVMLDAGDGVESFSNTSSQAFTNDLSFPDQLSLLATIQTRFIKTLADTHEEVRVAGVSSNHSQWRGSGKGILGKPADDWGLHTLRQIKTALEMNEKTFGHVSFFEPEEWDESLVLDVLGTGIGLHHGHLVGSQNNIPNFWAKHAHGAQPLAWADVLITGHFHNFTVQSSGRSMRTGRAKWSITLPSLDGGSSWWRNKSGDDSDPGLVVFTIDEETGFELSSLAVL